MEPSGLVPSATGTGRSPSRAGLPGRRRVPRGCRTGLLGQGPPRSRPPSGRRLPPPLGLPPTALAGVPPSRRPRAPCRDGSRIRVGALIAFSVPALDDDPVSFASGLPCASSSGAEAPHVRGLLGKPLPRSSGRSGSSRGFPRDDSRSFTLLETTSGLPEDSRDEDQRVRARVEAERRGRVAAARKALHAHPEARDLVMKDQTRQRMFCARFSIRPVEICPHQDDPSPVGSRCWWCRGVHNGFRHIRVDDETEVHRSPCDWLAEVRARDAAVLPGRMPGAEALARAPSPGGRDPLPHAGRDGVGWGAWGRGPTPLCLCSRPSMEKVTYVSLSTR